MEKTNYFSFTDLCGPSQGWRGTWLELMKSVSLCKGSHRQAGLGCMCMCACLSACCESQGTHLEATCAGLTMDSYCFEILNYIRKRGLELPLSWSIAGRTVSHLQACSLPGLSGEIWYPVTHGNEMERLDCVPVPRAWAAGRDRVGWELF